MKIWHSLWLHYGYLWLVSILYSQNITTLWWGGIRSDKYKNIIIIIKYRHVQAWKVCQSFHGMVVQETKTCYIWGNLESSFRDHWLISNPSTGNLLYKRKVTQVINPNEHFKGKMTLLSIQAERPCEPATAPYFPLVTPLWAIILYITSKLETHPSHQTLLLWSLP